MAGSNQNGSDWIWRIESRSLLLQLQLNESVVFTTDIKFDELNQVCKRGVAFSTTDAGVYTRYRDILKPLPLDLKSKFILAIYATVAVQFMKPQAAKSWLFKACDDDELEPVKNDTFVSITARDKGVYLVLDTQEQTSTVILVSQSHTLDDTRVLKQGKVIQVHNNRLSPILHKIQKDML